METSFESYVLLNFVMNTLVIAIIARSRETVNPANVLMAALIGVVYAVAMQFDVFSLLSHLPPRLALPFILSAIAFRTDDLLDVAKCGLLLLFGTVFSGGVLQFLLRYFEGAGGALFAACALIALAALAAALSFRTRRMSEIRVELLLTGELGRARIQALIDTGNRLREPLSGRPVVIVEEARIKRLLPPDFSSDEALKCLPPGFRLVRYGALGNQGTNAMVCFRPREVYASFGRGWMRAPDIWVAVYPGKMPGGECALAPAVIGTIQTASKKAVQRVSMRKGD